MVDSIGASLGGLQAATRRAQVSAQNLANQHSTSTRVDGNVVNEAYQPQRVLQTTENGVPKTTVETVANPTQKLYLPDDPQADEAGFVDIPNVDQAAELVNLKIASYDFKANAKAIQVAQNIEQSLLDIIT